MKTKEKISVYVRTVKGKTVCICHAGRKKCDSSCERDHVYRDIFEQWQKTMRRDRWGK